MRMTGKSLAAIRRPMLRVDRRIAFATSAMVSRGSGARRRLWREH
jgi:hypothetical protein